MRWRGSHCKWTLLGQLFLRWFGDWRLVQVLSVMASVGFIKTTKRQSHGIIVMYATIIPFISHVNTLISVGETHCGCPIKPIKCNSMAKRTGFHGVQRIDPMTCRAHYRAEVCGLGWNVLSQSHLMGILYRNSSSSEGEPSWLQLLFHISYTVALSLDQFEWMVSKVQLFYLFPEPGQF